MIETARQMHQVAEANGINSRSIIMFCVYDKKAVAFSPPNFYYQKGQAIRAFQDAVNDPQTAFNKHPEDYSLFQIGSWNELTGVVTPLSNPVPVEEALNLIIKTK